MRVLIVLLLFVSGCSVIAQTDEYGNNADYIDCGDLHAVYGGPKVQINIWRTLLRFVGLMAKDEDEEVAELLSKLEVVRVQVYELEENAEPAINMVEDIPKELHTMDWEPVVVVREEDEQIRIFIKIGEDVMKGLVVMSVDSETEAIFINIIGEIDPTQVGKVTKALDIDVAFAAQIPDEVILRPVDYNLPYGSKATLPGSLHFDIKPQNVLEKWDSAFECRTRFRAS